MQLGFEVSSFGKCCKQCNKKFCNYCKRLGHIIVRDEFRFYELLMSLDNDYEHIRGQLLNHSHCPSLNTAVNELVGEETRLATLQAQNKLKFWLLLLLLPPQSNYCKLLKLVIIGNKSTTTVTNTESTPPMFFVSIESQSSGSTINLSSTEP